MPTKSKLSPVKSTNSDGSLVYLTDISGIYGETIYKKNEENPEVYSTTTNTEGYGVPNSERNNLANYVVGIHKRISGDIPINIYPNDPLTAMNYVADAPPDGWSIYYLIQVPAPASFVAEDIAETTVIYNRLTGKLMQKKAGVLTIIDQKDLITDLRYNVFTHEEFFLAKTSFTLEEILEEFAKKKRLAVGEDCEEELKRLRNRLFDFNFLLESARNSYCLGYKYEAQNKIEFINKNLCRNVC